MKIKKLLLGASVALLGLSLAACNDSKQENRNTVVPYGSLNGNLNKVVATANNDLELSLEQYYTRLRANSYNTVANKINEYLYKTEYDAIQAMYKNENVSSLTTEQVNAFKLVDKDEDNNDVALFELDQTKYEDLRNSLLENINSSLSKTIFGSNSAEAIAKKTTKEINKSITTFIDNQAKLGLSITASDINYYFKNDSNYTLDSECDIIQFSNSTLEKLSKLVNETILSQAKNYSARKALYKIADEEYIYNEESETDTKNSNYLFKDSLIESTYNGSYKTFGTYQAIVIQFNSRRDALKALESVGDISTTDSAAALQTYLDLYNDYYSYKISSTLTADADEFTFRVDETVDDFEDISASASKLVKETLEDGEYLIEPRNINNKYVLAYRIETKYDYYVGSDQTKQLEYVDLSDSQKEEINNKIKENLIIANSTSYENTNNKELIAASDIKIYDPFFEYKFEYAYPNHYEIINETVKTTDNLIFSIGDDKYTVEEFYKDASDAYATSIITDHFQLEYANLYYDTFVEDYYIADDAHDKNVETLDSAISKFKKDENSTYPVEIGLENYLIGSYGYKTKDDVLKYYYDAKQALNTYKSLNIFKEWIEESSTPDGEKVYSISETAQEGFLKNILELGNSTYNDIFDINLDHILINIDDNADGTPDDPADFLAKNPAIQAEFEAAVTKLAKAIYTEAIHSDYKDNTLFETLTYIKTQYEEGKELLSNPGTTWDDYKDFNFLLTVEQLAASGNITQDTVSNFVVPFKEYVIDIYKTASKNNVEKEFEDGIFYFCYDEAGTTVGTTADSVSDTDLITFDALCATNYGYHMIILNEYNGPSSTQYTSNDDASGFQANLQIVLREYEDDDDNEISYYINTDAYNSVNNAASFNQLFIYYVQKQNADESSLDSDIITILSALFDDAITKYTSSDFQNFLLLELLDIKLSTESIANYTINSFAITAQINYYKNVITEYDSQSPYVSWVDGSLSNWDKPNKI